MSNRSPLTRIEGVLDYIHDNLDKTLSLEDLADQSCWSRWQLQRVFQSQTGLSVAQYIRELKLSLAAERVLAGQERMLDIAYELGFNSEVSFSRAFKQFFSSSPREYRQRGLRVGLRTPLAKLSKLASDYVVDNAFLQTRIEYKPSFIFYGVSSPFKGLLSDKPDFSTIVPETWHQLHKIIDAINLPEVNLLGVIDTRNEFDEVTQLNYWAGVTCISAQNEVDVDIRLTRLDIPAQEYAVVSYDGAVSGFGHVVEWLICHWLPESEYVGIEGFELENYGTSSKNELLVEGETQSRVKMEYWLPVKKKR
ncbi:AraC family transcriptional regulator [Shewanella eurypsychrophilus]|uniref:AraC family transcriptional regulator n=1 Tax=Shewanella eurypsychrophilus TaxID=2593656 RepID=A0ABX6V0P4_9GAMM|nr:MULTISPECIES: AraC family transcriptional regulator [Shewanella]QFU20622.1 helix-turn-helix domain-containing protein [Shewanella sp. YLB-09]QFU20903.1 helix-turn-helix domain-containing protein [Shewanella sp. YLB-09]QPG56191.1 AraC family transcriptional regulator [Shewanella eurypsychrophilus]